MAFWVLDGFPSGRQLTREQPDAVGGMCRDLYRMPEASGAILFNATLVAAPRSEAAGLGTLVEVVPPFPHAEEQPLHAALGGADDCFNRAGAAIRMQGGNRTVSVCLLATGNETGCTPVELLAAVERFHASCVWWAIIPIVVVVGQSLDSFVLDALAPAVSLLELPTLDVDVLVSFVTKVVARVSR